MDDDHQKNDDEDVNLVHADISLNHFHHQHLILIISPFLIKIVITIIRITIVLINITFLLAINDISKYENYIFQTKGGADNMKMIDVANKRRG